jgi:hypothetical protein
MNSSMVDPAGALEALSPGVIGARSGATPRSP